MWNYSTDYNKWFSYQDTLKVDTYNFFKQELQSVRFYSKCLSGATYLPVNDLQNIYDILGEYELRNWYVSILGSSYSNTLIPSKNPVAIDSTTQYDFYNKFLPEYGLTLKNHFTPRRIIKDSAKNLRQVDVATTIQIDLTQSITEIDGVILKKGHKVLVKNQRNSVVLLSTDNPDDYIKGNYEILEDLGTTIEYIFFDETNGLYEFDGQSLVRLNDLDDYEKCIRLSVYVKLGKNNAEKQFHLSRLRNGYFPTSLFSEPIEFTEKKNWLLRNRVDYNNLFEINYYDIKKFDFQFYEIDQVIYNIPQRLISIGEFGIILNTQHGVSNIIENKYKVNLRSISETEKYYWIVGDDGILLRVRKHDFLIERIEVDCNCPRNLVTTDLYCIHFFNDLKGVAVGELNTILVTKDGGLNWKRLRITDFDAFTYTQCLYYNLNSFFIAGYNGVFIEFTEDITGWNAVRRRISRYIDDDDEYLLVDNINRILKTNLTSWGLSYSFSTQSTSSDKDVLFLVGDDSKIIVYDINGSIPEHDFLYLDFSNSPTFSSNYGDIKNIIRQGTSSNVFYFTGQDPSTGVENIYSIDINNYQNIGVGSSYSNTVVGTLPTEVISNISPNKIEDFNGERILICGNNSLLLTSSYSVVDLQVPDPEFEKKLKSKLLFLDYDIGSKLAFFTDFGEYRLPNSVTFSSASFSVTSSLAFSPIVYASATPSFLTQSETNWISYWTDASKTFQYYSNTPFDESTKILMSSTFSFTNGTSSVSIDPTVGLTTEAWAIGNLAPSIINPTSSIGTHSSGISSRYSGAGLTAISAPTASYDLYLHDYMFIAKFGTASFDVSVGDLIYFESSVVNSKLLVNRIETFSGKKYVYMFNDFNGQMITDISQSTYSVTLTNLNRYTSANQFVERFQNHPFSLGYTVENNSGQVNISAQFNNITAYYNLATNVDLSGNSKSMSYTSGFLNFGYTPTYNLLDYFENINDKKSVNPIFSANKEFYSMPHYLAMPLHGVGNFTADNLYIEYNGITYSSITDNKILFGANRKLEWESLFLNTFVDITIYATSSYGGSPNYESKRLLVTKKYYNKTEDYYVIEFHRNLNFPINTTLFWIDIKSRRKLVEISDDLQELNNISRGKFKTKKLFIGSEFKNYERELNYKVSTDSYAKILMSESEVVKNITAMIYTDYNNELAMNVANLGKDYNIPILNTANFGGKVYISCGQKHELTDGEGVVLEWTGGTGSSQQINQQYFGYFPVKVFSEYNFTIDIPYGLAPTVGVDSGFVKYTRKDPFLNYQPVDIIDLGVDKKPKQSVELKVENIMLKDNKYKVIGVDFTKYRYRLVDGLNIESLSEKYPWILEAEISDAILGENPDGIVWYKGTWECGRWFGGTWISGSWVSGDWYGGIWRSLTINDKKISVEIDEKSSSEFNSTWFGGRWYDGTWENGLWVDGRWYGGIWNDGIWYKGIWNDGTWLDGNFTGGVWVIGKWYDGFFNCDNNPAYWLDGEWFGGDFENGMWYNGLFDVKDFSTERLTVPKRSRFGTKSFNSRTATWHGGKWAQGSFYSKVNINDEGKEDVSDVHKYSIWYTGQWLSGDWYGGIAYNMNFKSGTWHGGILEDIQIIGMDSTENYFVANGIFKFNIGDEITVVDNRSESLLGQTYGSTVIPKKHIILYTVEDSVNKWTKIYVATNIVDTITEPDYTGLWIVSRFKNANWKSGIWTNGVYESGNWEGGLWYNGVFEGIWM